MMQSTGVVRVTSLSLHSAIFIVIPDHHPWTCFSTPVHLCLHYHSRLASPIPHDLSMMWHACMHYCFSNIRNNLSDTTTNHDRYDDKVNECVTTHTRPQVDVLTCTFLVLQQYKSPLLQWYCGPSMSQTFLVSTPSPLRLFRCFPILSDPVLLPPTLNTFLRIHSTPSLTQPDHFFLLHGGGKNIKKKAVWLCETIQHQQWTPPSINQLTRAETLIYSDNSPRH